MPQTLDFRWDFTSDEQPKNFTELMREIREDEVREVAPTAHFNRWASRTARSQQDSRDFHCGRFVTTATDGFDPILGGVA